VLPLPDPGSFFRSRIFMIIIKINTVEILEEVNFSPRRSACCAFFSMELLLPEWPRHNIIRHGNIPPMMAPDGIYALKLHGCAVPLEYSIRIGCAVPLRYRICTGTAGLGYRKLRLDLSINDIQG